MPAYSSWDWQRGKGEVATALLSSTPSDSPEAPAYVVCHSLPSAGTVGGADGRGHDGQAVGSPLPGQIESGTSLLSFALLGSSSWREKSQNPHG